MTSYPPPVPPDAFVRLATDLAMEVRTPAETFAEWGLGLPGQDPRTDALMDNTAFAEIYEQIQREWDGVKGTNQRIKLKSALIVEETLPAVYKMIMAEDGDHKLRLEAFRQLSKMSGVEDDAKKGDSSGERFVVNIRIGETVHAISTDEDAPRTIEVTPDPEQGPGRSPGTYGSGFSDDDPGGINLGLFGS
jgi:hypothetical protein